MKLWSLVIVFFFINFTALPSVGAIFDWDLPANNLMVNEEETHTTVFSFEKALPDTLNVHEFLKFFQTDNNTYAFLHMDDSIHLSPYLTIFSPPPEA